jgi:hypothetical protein
MKNFNSRTVLLCIVMVLMAKVSFVSAAPQVDSISITIYADCRSWADLVVTPGAPDSTANAHNASQYSSYDPAVMYITGSWTHPSTPGGTDWTFIEMDSIAPDIFKATFNYAPGQFAGNTGDDPDLTADHPAWYFCPTNDWSTNEWVPPTCNVAWDVQRIFEIDIIKADTVAAFKYGVCEPVSLASIGVEGPTGVSDISAFGNVNIFPNPASESITLKNIGGATAMKIIDFTGKVVKEVNLSGIDDTMISTSDLPSQLYLVQFLFNNGKMSTAKLVIK